MIIPECRERFFGFKFRHFLFHESIFVKIEIIFFFSHVFMAGLWRVWRVYGGFIFVWGLELVSSWLLCSVLPARLPQSYPEPQALRDDADL